MPTNSSAPRPPSSAELEASLEAYFQTTVRRSLGGMVIKLSPTKRGLPDRIVLLPGGRIKLVELKTTTGRVSAIQAVVHDRIRELGTPVDVLAGRAEVDRWIRAQFPSDRELARDRAAGKVMAGVTPAEALAYTRRQTAV